MLMADGLNTDVLNGGRPWSTRRLLSFLLAGVALVAACVLAWLGYDHYRVHHLWQEAQESIRNHDPRGAMASLDQFTARKPGDLDGLFLAARTARRLGKFPEAKRYLAAYVIRGEAKTRFAWSGT